MCMTKDINGVRAIFDNAVVDGGLITLQKSEIENWIAQFESLGADKMQHGCPTWESWFYWGKREVMVDLLKHFK